MTQLLQSLRDELVRRDYAATTIRSYVQKSLTRFAQYLGAPPNRITCPPTRNPVLVVVVVVAGLD